MEKFTEVKYLVKTNLRIAVLRVEDMKADSKCYSIRPSFCIYLDSRVESIKRFHSVHWMQGMNTREPVNYHTPRSLAWDPWRLAGGVQDQRPELHRLLDVSYPHIALVLLSREVGGDVAICLYLRYTAPDGRS